MKAYKFRLYPSREQISILEGQLNLCRELYNAMLEQREWAHRLGKKITFFDQQNQIPEIKKAFPEYARIHSQVLQDVARRLDRGFDNAFRRARERKSGKKVRIGFLRFKGKGRYRSITYPQSGFEVMDDGHLLASKIGEIRMFMHREIEGSIKTLTISKDGIGDWFASLSCEVEPTPHITIPKESKAATGFDPGLKTLLVGSDGTRIETPHFFVKAEKRIKRAQRNVSRRLEGSKNREKAKLRLAKRHRKVKRQREDLVYKTGNSIAARNDIICFEDTNMERMVHNHHLAKSILDASWNSLVRYTTYKAESAGKVVVPVDPRNTSRTCSRCGWIKEDLRLSDRMFHCDACGLDIDRDLNAAINIRNGGLRKLREELGEGIPEVTPVEIGALPDWATPVVEAGSPLRQRGEDVTLRYNQL